MRSGGLKVNLRYQQEPPPTRPFVIENRCIRFIAFTGGSSRCPHSSGRTRRYLAFTASVRRPVPNERPCGGLGKPATSPTSVLRALPGEPPWPRVHVAPSERQKPIAKSVVGWVVKGLGHVKIRKDLLNGLSIVHGGDGDPSLFAFDKIGPHNE